MEIQGYSEGWQLGQGKTDKQLRNYLKTKKIYNHLKFQF